MKKDTAIKLFNDNKVRVQWDEKTEKWYFSVIDVIDNEKLIDNANLVSEYFLERIKEIPQVKKVKGKGLMLGVEFDFDVAELRKKLIYTHHIFTGGASNKKLLRILPPLNIKKEQIADLIEALKEEL